jgi:hypothetical protein
VALFTEWRTFEEPPRVGGIPDYRPATNTRRLAGLTRLQQRLRAIDTTGWRVAEQVDWHLVRAEMNGLQYHLTVLKPFARDPAYYASVRTDESDTPAEEGPTIHGAIRLWQYPVWPRTVLDTLRTLTAEEAARLAGQLRTVPPLLRQARVHLAGANARDLWVGGVRAFEEQHEALGELRRRVGAGDAALVAAIDSAAAATDAFAAWLRAEAPKKTGPSGIGTAQYTWYLRNVLLVPLSWEQELTIVRRELARAHAALRLEENRNRHLPPLPVAETPAAFDALREAALPRYLQFIRDQQVVTWEPWMERALRERFMGFVPPATANFFSQGAQRDPVPLWTHLWHWWDNGRIRRTPHASPIRRGPRAGEPVRARQHAHHGAGGGHPRELDAARVDAPRPAAGVRAAPVPAAAGVRRQLRDRRAADGGDDGRARAAAGGPVFAAPLLRRGERGGDGPGVDGVLGAHRGRPDGARLGAGDAAAVPVSRDGAAWPPPAPQRLSPYTR